MKNFTIAIALISILASCKGSKKESNNENAENGNAELSIGGNYLHANNGDTVLLVLQNTDSMISGKLDILPYQKDSRKGTIENGEMKGDTLFAIFNSMQEGSRSDCEIAFLKNGNSFILSNDIYGMDNYQYNSDYSKGSFINRKTIKFDGETLKKVISQQ